MIGFVELLKVSEGPGALSAIAGETSPSPVTYQQSFSHVRGIRRRHQREIQMLDDRVADAIRALCQNPRCRLADECSDHVRGHAVVDDLNCATCEVPAAAAVPYGTTTAMAPCVT